MMTTVVIARKWRFAARADGARKWPAASGASTRCEPVFGIKAEGRRLEGIAKPLTAVST